MKITVIIRLPLIGGLSVHQNRGACATFPDGTRRYDFDSRTYEIEELPYKISELLKEEISECEDIEYIYLFRGKT